MSIRTNAILALENGVIFRGTSFGSHQERSGEVVFNTSMTGYQEVMTDPSYSGQMVVMTYPHIGNYGINSFDHESDAIHLEAIIVKDYCDHPTSFRSQKTLSQFLREFDVPAISGIDTRYLTRILRKEGCLRAVISTSEENPNTLIDKAKTIPPMSGLNLAQKVSTKQIYEWQDRCLAPPVSGTRPGASLKHVVAIDLGIKHTILKKLSEVGCRVTVVPHDTSSEKILSLKPDGIFLSNGPGDPQAVTTTIQTIKELIGKKPIFGICLGHQILGLALGGTTSKLKFGHHGMNHPILNRQTTSVEITSQNHNFVVDLNSIQEKVKVTHINLNDHTIEGFRDTDRNILSIQYHPESAPGPHDSGYLFLEFKHMMEKQ